MNKLNLTVREVMAQLNLNLSRLVKASVCFKQSACRTVEQLLKPPPPPTTLRQWK